MKKNEHKLLEINYLKKYCDEMLKDTDQESVRKKLKDLLEFYGVINFKLILPENTQVFRARKCTENGFDSINQMGCPPANLTKAGRLNEPENPILYVSLNMWAAFDEIGINKDDYVQVISYKYKEGNSPRVAYIGDVKDVYRWGSSKHGRELTEFILSNFAAYIKRGDCSFESYIFTDSFLSSLLTDKSAKEKEYIHTNAMARFIFEKNPSIHGICYQGIESSGALNLAFSENSYSDYLEVNNTMVLKVSECYGFGLYEDKILKKSKSIEGNGKILWDNNAV
jgi:hypothetical protein